jgi:flagellar M-ring protein FliF
MFSQVREQFLSIWNRQSMVQRVVLVTLLVTAVALMAVFLSWAQTPTYAVAFSGLAEEDAGQIVEKLQEAGMDYQLRSGGQILVPSNSVYEMRLSMARQGLPAGSNVGLELFSGNTLGMTEFTQRVNYQRAMEGELERTIGSMDVVDAVRVHIVTPEKTLLSEDQAPTTAAITIREKAGQHLNVAQIKAITHLAASSIEALKPENVVVVDADGNLLASGSQDGGVSADLAQNDSQHAAEQAASFELKTKVEDLLGKALGPNRSVVQASVVMDWTQRETTSQGYDPTTATIRSSQLVTEVYTTTGGLVGGVPGASSNLPTMTGATSGEDQNTQYARSEETTNFEITQTEVKEVKAPGEIQRISLSVLVDGVTDTVQLEKLQAVIGAAAGINQTRGDLLAVQSLDFDRSYYETQAAELEAQTQTDLYWQIGVMAAGALLLFLLLWYVQRLLTNLRLTSAQAWTPVMKPVAEMALPQPSFSMAGLGAADGMGELPLSQPVASGSFPGLGSVQPEPKQPEPIKITLPQIEVPQISAEEEQMQRLLIQMAEENPAAVAEIIQMWLNEEVR